MGLAFPDGTSQHSQPDDACDHTSLEAWVSQKTGHHTQPNPQHDHAILMARRGRVLQCHAGLS
jgi:hypothetical protein